MTMPRTSPIAHPVRQCAVARAAVDQDTDAQPPTVSPPSCACAGSAFVPIDDGPFFIACLPR
jgi:hypothetical protein